MKSKSDAWITGARGQRRQGEIGIFGGWPEELDKDWEVLVLSNWTVLIGLFLLSMVNEYVLHHQKLYILAMYIDRQTLKLQSVCILCLILLAGQEMLCWENTL